MKSVEVYKGYEIICTDRTVSSADKTKSSELPIYVISGLKERLDNPYLTSVADAREFIDGEIAGREAFRKMMTIKWTAIVRHRGNSLAVVIPAKYAKELQLDDGMEVEVTLEKL